ncbi:hypothetical protein [Streptomyces sp. NPDC004232]|uniref:hypothetical protein n=1 Tax=unclassified Streptomyces TaxID=2593676 RepID=UPI001DA53740|nr:hypothetical protein [Streptomyces sp. tea 10]
MSDTPELPDGCEFSGASVRGKGVGRIRDHLEPFGLRRVLQPLERPEPWMVHLFT